MPEVLPRLRCCSPSMGQVSRRTPWVCATDVQMSWRSRPHQGRIAEMKKRVKGNAAAAAPLYLNAPTVIEVRTPSPSMTTWAMTQFDGSDLHRHVGFRHHSWSIARFRRTRGKLHL